MEPANVNEYETLAQARMEPGAWDFFQGGSDDEVTLHQNNLSTHSLQCIINMQ